MKINRRTALKAILSGMLLPLVPVGSLSTAPPAITPAALDYWAHESLKLLRENMVMARLVNRDYDPKVSYPLHTRTIEVPLPRWNDGCKS
jgi:hypothetical protein